MKGKRVIAGMLLAGILAVTLAGCKHTDVSKNRNRKAGHHAGERQLSTI